MGCGTTNAIDENKKEKTKSIMEDEGSFQELEPQLQSNEIKNYSGDIELYQKFSKSFDYFNICWYDPNHSDDCIRFRQAFKKVEVVRGYSDDSIINFFNNYSDVKEFILISPGKNGKNLIPKIHDNKSIKAIIIFCYNTELHKVWAKNYKKIKGVVSTETGLFQNLDEINKNYYFPEYNYGLENNKIKMSYILFDYEKINNKGYTGRLINALKRECDDYIKMIKININYSV